MFEPSYMCDRSLVEKLVIIKGDLDFAGKIEKFSNESCKRISLYFAQEQFREYVIENKGIDFYFKYGEAINYIIENTYCNLEREKLPAYDMKQYKYDMTHGVMY